jgi:hypothetical protein
MSSGSNFNFAGLRPCNNDAHGLLDDARRLAVSESHTEIESLVWKMLSKLLPAEANGANSPS